MNHIPESFTSLDLLIKFTEFKCKSSDTTVSVERYGMDTGAFNTLSQVWVQVMGFPKWARYEKIVEEVAYLIGDPDMVDIASLAREGNIRLRV